MNVILVADVIHLGEKSTIVCAIPNHVIVYTQIPEVTRSLV